jgi:hypothetical protein
MSYRPEIKQRALELIQEGYSPGKAADALSKEFPKELKHPDERTIRRWRKALLEQQKEMKLEPIVLSRMEEHFEHLADIVWAVLSNPYNLDGVKENPSRGTPFDIFKYTLWESGSGQGITHGQLSSMLGENIDRVDYVFAEFDFYCLILHLRAESPEIEAKGFYTVATENPYELIDTLRILARRKTFKGTCPVCQDW